MSQAEVFELHPKARATPFVITGDAGPLFEAFALAQGEFQPIERTRTVHVKSDKGNYDFDYAPLDEVLRKTIPALSKNGLTIWNPIGDSGTDLLIGAVLSHKSGAYIMTQVAVSQIKTWWKDGKQYEALKSNQERGSDITYWKRYTACALLGVSADMDDDGAAGEQMPRSVSDRGPHQGTQPKPPVPKPKAVEQTRPQLVKAVADAAPQATRSDNKVTKETRDAMKPLLRELGFSTNLALMNEWSTKLIGVELHQLETEEHGQLLLADLIRRKNESGNKEAS